MKKHQISVIFFTEIPSSIPEVNLTLTTIEKFRYHMNVCTFGYTYAFWKWSQWEQHIDWMALNGINLPLAFVAQEAIWERVYTKVKSRCKLIVLNIICRYCNPIN